MKSKVAIVILNWNGLKMLAQYLPTVIDYSRMDADIWVADNASTDESIEFITAHYPMVNTLRLEKNYGFAEGYNRCLQEIEADYYVLLNSDVEVTHHWLEPLIELMDAHPEVAACQPKLLAEYDKDAFEYAGASGGLIDKYGYPYCRGRIFDTVEKDQGQYDYRQEIFGLQVLALWFVHLITGKLVDLMDVFLRIMRKLTYVGDCVFWVKKFIVSPRVMFIM